MCECGCGQILLECNHVGCTVSDKMAKQLRSMLDRGDTDDQIKNAFVQEYGVVVLAAPTNKGFDRVAWIMPFVVFALGILAVVYVVRTWKSRQAVAAVIADAAPAEMDAMKRRAREETEV
jgi:cytochrome c-type biogenesis protein CcmH